MRAWRPFRWGRGSCPRPPGSEGNCVVAAPLTFPTAPGTHGEASSIVLESGVAGPLAQW